MSQVDERQVERILVDAVRGAGTGREVQRQPQFHRTQFQDRYPVAALRRRREDR
jgi:hypothetical protein